MKRGIPSKAFRYVLIGSLLVNGVAAIGLMSGGREAEAETEPRGTFELVMASPQAAGGMMKLGPYLSKKSCDAAKDQAEAAWIDSISGEAKPLTQWESPADKTRFSREVKVTVMGWRPTGKCFEVGL